MGTSTSSSSFLARFLFQALVLGLVCLLVIVSLLGTGEGTRKTATLSTSSAERLNKHEHVIGRGRDKLVNHAELDFTYMSNRKVPNGPDPIHNRRAGNSGRPPGQA